MTLRQEFFSHQFSTNPCPLATSLAMAVQVKNPAQKRMISPCGHTSGGVGRRACPVLEPVRERRPEPGRCVLRLHVVAQLWARIGEPASAQRSPD